MSHGWTKRKLSFFLTTLPQVASYAYKKTLVRVNPRIVHVKSPRFSRHKRFTTPNSVFTPDPFSDPLRFSHLVLRGEQDPAVGAIFTQLFSMHPLQRLFTLVINVAMRVAKPRWLVHLMGCEVLQEQLVFLHHQVSIFGNGTFLSHGESMTNGLSS